MNAKNIRPIPKYIITRIQAQDKKECPWQKGPVRFYAYLTSIKKELVKITVAVKNHKKKWYCKQVAAHGVRSDKCCVKDMEYGYMGSMGLRVGWYADGLQNYSKWFEDGRWHNANSKYYNPWTTIVNWEFISKFPEYRYSAYQRFRGKCIIEYLKLYNRFPQVEYLMKLGLHQFHDSVMVLRRIEKDKKFCQWLVKNRNEFTFKYYYVTTILEAYKSGKSLEQTQKLNVRKKGLSQDSNLKPIRELFKGKELERFFSYVDAQNIGMRSYLDYLNACNHLGLDMNLPKNRYPHNFKHWHDIRIDEYHSKKAKDDEEKRAEFYAQFAVVAEKYMALQKLQGNYAVVIATSPAELMREGEELSHCVGKMGYDQKMVREETLIFFVRNNSELDVPFVTVEYSLKQKRILQSYGSNHSKPDEAVANFINKTWLSHANRTIKKMVSVIPAA